MLRISVVWVVWDLMKGFSTDVMLEKGVVKVLWDARNLCGLARIGFRIIDCCHLVTPGQGANSRKLRVSRACYRGGECLDIVIYTVQNLHMLRAFQELTRYIVTQLHSLN